MRVGGVTSSAAGWLLLWIVSCSDGGSTNGNTQTSSTTVTDACEALCNRASAAASAIGCNPVVHSECAQNCAEDFLGPSCPTQVQSFSSCYTDALGAANCHCETDNSLNCEEIYKDNEHPSGVAPCSSQAAALNSCQDANPSSGGNSNNSPPVNVTGGTGGSAGATNGGTSAGAAGAGVAQ